MNPFLVHLLLAGLVGPFGDLKDVRVERVGNPMNVSIAIVEGSREIAKVFVNGDFYFRGEKVTTDAKIYKIAKKLLDSGCQ